MKPSEKTSVPERLKYIEIKIYILHDRVQSGEVVLQYISTDEQILDILVKPLSKMKSLCTYGTGWTRGDEFIIGKGSDYMLLIYR